LNFSTSNSFHQAQWKLPPSGAPDSGLLFFDRDTDLMDLSQIVAHAGSSSGSGNEQGEATWRQASDAQVDSGLTP
jgi:hypothetical protein